MFRCCAHRGAAAVRMRSAKRLPPARCVPNERLRHRTPHRIWRSAWLFVGSMPATSMNVQSAGRSLATSRQSAEGSEQVFGRGVSATTVMAAVHDAQAEVLRWQNAPITDAIRYLTL